MQRKQYLSSISLLIMLTLALVFAVLATFDNSLAWFASNDRVDANGMSISVRGLPETEEYLMIDGERIDSSAANLFSGLTPGETATLEVYVRNKTSEKIKFKLLMAAPTEDNDTPYIVNDELYHYFGTQIRINSAKGNGQELLFPTSNDRYLLPLDDSLYIGEDASLPPTSIDSEYDFSILSDKVLIDFVEIEANGEFIVELEFEFVDNNTLQNPYIDFANPNSSDPEKAALNLSRTLICSYEYAN